MSHIKYDVPSHKPYIEGKKVIADIKRITGYTWLRRFVMSDYEPKRPFLPYQEQSMPQTSKTRRPSYREDGFQPSTTSPDDQEIKIPNPERVRKMPGYIA